MRPQTVTPSTTRPTRATRPSVVVRDDKPFNLDDAREVYDQLAEEGWVVIPNFLNPNLVLALREDLRERKAAGEFKKAAVGKGKKAKIDASIRGDSILWLDQAKASPLQQQLWAKIEDLKTALNRELFLGVRGFEGHYAAYPPAGKYEKHRDAFKEDDNRSVSMVLYLNEGWQSQWGGQLKMYDPKANKNKGDGKGGEGIVAEVEPRGGTLVLFMSSEVEHEVVASSMERLSFTGWFLQKTPN